MFGFRRCAASLNALALVNVLVALALPHRLRAQATAESEQLRKTRMEVMERAVAAFKVERPGSRQAQPLPPNRCCGTAIRPA